MRAMSLTRRLRTARRAAVTSAFPQRTGRTAIRSSGLPMGALLIAVVSATALVPVSTQALTWSVAPSPNVNPAKDNNVLDAVSCVSATRCMATGYYYGKSKHGHLETALTEAWNGTKWSVAPSPSPLGSALYGVSCISATACVSVGAGFVGSVQLEEFWNGTRWSVMPNTGNNLGSELLGVSCVSRTDCIAVGDKPSSAGSHYVTFIQSWNGSTWSTVPSPNAGSSDNFLSGVSCISATACIAAGQFSFGGFHSAPLIESWNGTRWSIVPAPNKAKSGYLNGLSCASADACAAVGTYLYGQYEDNKALLESWDGTRWSAGPSPSEQAQLDGVSCVSAAGCWAAGNSWAKDGTVRAFMELWNGTNWSVVPVPQAGSPGATFGAVSCASATFCAAVGARGAGTETLIEFGTPGG